MPVRVKSSVIKTMAECIFDKTYSESKKSTKGLRSMSAVSLRSGGPYKYERRKPQGVVAPQIGGGISPEALGVRAP
jgi:hypothetical protein